MKRDNNDEDGQFEGLLLLLLSVGEKDKWEGIGLDGGA